MTNWWESDPSESYWVEIRKYEGIGSNLNCPDADGNGNFNGYFDLVSRVRRGDTIYHYSARESRFVGRSVVRRKPFHDPHDRTFNVDLKSFTPLVGTVDLAFLRSEADYLYNFRDSLRLQDDRSLFLPFQFRQDRSSLRMVSNYLAKLPRTWVDRFFGSDGLATNRADFVGTLPGQSGSASRATGGPGQFLQPFRPKADTDYNAHIVGGTPVRTRKHERLVNHCNLWLEQQGLETGRNATVDLGTLAPDSIIEAKIFTGSWAPTIRQAVGQLYEYRFFGVAAPYTPVVFLADVAVPKEWVKYLETDRVIGVMWPERGGYHLSKIARAALGL